MEVEEIVMSSESRDCCSQSEQPNTENRINEEIRDDVVAEYFQQNSENEKESKTCENDTKIPLPSYPGAMQMNTGMHNIIVPVKKNGTVKLPLSYLKARQALLRNKKRASKVNIITVRSFEDNESIEKEISELESSKTDVPPSEALSSSLPSTFSNSFAVAAAEAKKRAIILNPGLVDSNLTVDKLQNGFFAEVPDKDNPGKFISYFVIPTESSLSEIMLKGKRLVMDPRLKDCPSYLVEPLPEPDFEIPIGDDTHEGEVVKKLSKTKFSSRLLFKSYLQSLLEDPDYRLVFVCKKCGRKFLQKWQFIKHLETWHLGESVFECNVCKKSFETNVLMRKHKNTVHKENNICEICGSVFATHYILMNHLNKHPKLSCDICGYRHKYVREIELHKTKHYKDAKFLKKSLFDQRKPWCNLCGIGLESDQHLEVHNRIKHRVLKKEESS